MPASADPSHFPIRAPDAACEVIVLAGVQVLTHFGRYFIAVIFMDGRHDTIEFSDAFFDAEDRAGIGGHVK